MERHNTSDYLRSLIRWSQSNQGCLTLALGIAVYYVAIYRPLHQRTEALDEPLRVAWGRLEAAHQQSLSQDRLDLDQISRGLKHLESNLIERTNTNQKLLARISIEPEYQDKLENPFQLIEFQNERQSIVEAIGRLAQEKATKIDPVVFEGFPQHLSQQTSPQFLWAELALTKHLVQSMIFAEIASVEKLSTVRQRIVSTPDTGSISRLTPFLSEIEISCEAGQLSKFLLMLPSRSTEIFEQLGMSYPPHKPSLFVDQILVQKDSRENPNHVSVWMKVVGFILAAPNQTSNLQEG